MAGGLASGCRTLCAVITGRPFETEAFLARREAQRRMLLGLPPGAVQAALDRGALDPEVDKNSPRRVLENALRDLADSYAAKLGDLVPTLMAKADAQTLFAFANHNWTPTWRQGPGSEHPLKASLDELHARADDDQPPIDDHVFDQLGGLALLLIWADQVADDTYSDWRLR